MRFRTPANLHDRKFSFNRNNKTLNTSIQKVYDTNLSHQYKSRLEENKE